MDKLLQALAVLATVLGSVHLASPQAQAQPHVDDGQYDAGLATYGGVTAWWGATDDPKVAHLMVRTRLGKVKALPPTLSTFAPTVDVGRGPGGRPLITYAQCGRSMASCLAYSYNLATNEQVPLHVGQAVAVAVDGEHVAWFRETREDGPSQLLVGKANAFGVAHPRRVPLPEIGDEPAGGPLALDLRGGRLAFAANTSGDDIRSEALWAGTPEHLESIDGGGYGEECTRVAAAPTITPTALTWLRTTSGTSSCGARVGTLVRRAWSGGALSHAAVPTKVPKEAVVVGGHTLVLAPARTDGDQGDRDACVPEPLTMEDAGGGPRACALRTLAAPRWLSGGRP